MNLTLRKASAVQAVIMDKINSIELATTVSINEFQAPGEVIRAASDKLLANIKLKEDLFDAYYEIRTSLGSANASYGVNRKLAALVSLEKKILMYRLLAASSAREDSTVVDGKLSRLKNADSVNYAYRDTLQTGVLTQSKIAEFEANIATFTKEKQKLNDEILGINIINSIDLSVETAALLSKYNII